MSLGGEQSLQLIGGLVHLLGCGTLRDACRVAGGARSRQPLQLHPPKAGFPVLSPRSWQKYQYRGPRVSGSMIAHGWI